MLLRKHTIIVLFMMVWPYQDIYSLHFSNFFFTNPQTHTGTISLSMLLLGQCSSSENNIMNELINVRYNKFNASRLYGTQGHPTASFPSHLFSFFSKTVITNTLYPSQTSRLISWLLRHCNLCIFLSLLLSFSTNFISIESCTILTCPN